MDIQEISDGDLILVFELFPEEVAERLQMDYYIHGRAYWDNKQRKVIPPHLVRKIVDIHTRKVTYHLLEEDGADPAAD